MISIREILKKFIYTFHPRNFSRHTGTKMLALLIAVVLWFFVMDQENPEQIKSLDQVPIQLLNVEELSRNNLVLMDQQDFFVDVKVKGRRNDLIDLDQNDVSLSVDLVGYGQGVNSIYISRSTNSEDYTITELSDETIKVFLDRIIEVQKPVVITEVGEISNGFVKEEMIVEPSVVLVKGPESIVNAVDQIIGEIDIADSETTVSTSIPLQPVDVDLEFVSDVTLSNTYVTVTVPVNKLKLMTVNPETAGIVNEEYKLTNISVTPDQVLVIGPKDIINDFLKLKTVEMNIDGLLESSKQDLVLRLPEGVTTQLEGNKVSVSVEVEKIETQEYRFAIKDIPTRNLNEGLETDISLNEGEIILQVNDVASVLNALKKDDFDLFINVRDLTPGTYQLPINVASDVDSETYTLEPNVLEVTISEIVEETESVEETETTEGTQESN